MARYIIFICFLLLPLLLSAEDSFYKILGISKRATEKEIKKAYKKGALLYHPDKNRENTEWAQEKFIELTEAYETLKDPEKKKIYDTYGREGLKQEQQRNQGGGQHWSNNFGNYEDMFSSFFQGGSGGGGQQFHFNMGGGGFGGQGHQPQTQMEPFFTDSNVLELETSNYRRFQRRVDVWLVVFYKLDKKSERIKDIWMKLADKMSGIAQIGAVNCANTPEICEEHGIKRFPTILCFPSDSGKQPSKYKIRVSVKRLSEFAIKHMENYVQFIDSDNIQKFREEAPMKMKVLLFSGKKRIPAIFKALSKEFKEKLVFGFIKDNQELMKKFSIETQPAILLLDQQHIDIGEIYTGENKRQKISKWLRLYTYQTKRKSTRKPNPGQALIFSEEVHNKGICGDSDKQFCAILFVDNLSLHQEKVEVIKRMADQYKGDPVNFFFTDKKYLQSINGVGANFELPSLIIIKGKRHRFSVLQGSIEDENISAKLDSLISGNLKFQRIQADNVFEFQAGKKQDL